MRRGPRLALRLLPGSTGPVIPASQSGTTSPACVDDGSCTTPVQRVVMAMPRAVRLTGTRAMEPTRSTDVAEASSPSLATAESKVRRNTVRRPPVTTALSWRYSPPHAYRPWATAIASVQGADRPIQPSSAPRSVSPTRPLARQGFCTLWHGAVPRGVRARRRSAVTATVERPCHDVVARPR
jgi:hypothetical protein